MSHVKSLLALMPFNTFGHKYGSRVIKPGREELELVLDGQAIYDHDGSKFSVSPGHLLWHRPGDRTIRSNQYSHNYECLILAFDVSDDDSPYHPHWSVWDGLIGARQFAEDALQKFSENMNNPAFCQYLYNSCEIHSKGINSTTNQQIAAERICVDKAIQFMAQNFNQHLDIETIANAAHVSSSSLHFLIKEYTGLTPHQMLLKYRMEQAIKMVVQKKTLKQISTECGFESESGFVRAFKKSYGMTPKQFRKPGLSSPAVKTMLRRLASA